MSEHRGCGREEGRGPDGRLEEAGRDPDAHLLPGSDVSFEVDGGTCKPYVPFTLCSLVLMQRGDLLPAWVDFGRDGCGGSG